MKKMREPGSVEKLLCCRCAVHTNHTLLDTYQTSDHDDENDVSWGATHDFLRCNGCDSATYRQTSWFSEEPGESIALYPPRGSQEVIREPKYFESIPPSSPVYSVYRETLNAYNQQSYTLAGAGVRLIVEGVCKHCGISDGPVFNKSTGQQIVNKKSKLPVRPTNLEGRINGLAEKGIIGTEQTKTLHEIRFLGNDAAHELDRPSRHTVNMAVDIVEHILNQVYEQPELGKALAERKKRKSP